MIDENRIVEFNGHSYEITKATALQQMNMIRMLAGLVTSDGAESIFKEWSKLPQEQADKLVTMMLTPVRRIIPNGKAPIITNGAISALWEDELDLDVIMRLVMSVAEVNIYPFLEKLGVTFKPPELTTG